MVISAIEINREVSEGARRSRRAPRARGWAWFLIPSLILVGFFFVLPFVLNVPFAFSQWSSYTDEITFVGLDNFAFLWNNGALGGAILITLLYAVVAMVVQNTVALSLAIALRDTTRLNTLFRSLFFLPVLISPLAAGYIWRGIVDPAGPLNAAIAVFIPGFDFAWLGDPVTALIVVAFVDGWKWSGIATLVYIAGLNSIPASLMEAASLDGANGWQRFWRVSFPLLAPAFTFNVATTLVGALSAYDIIAAATKGGPGTSTTTLNVAVQQQFSYGYFGTASIIQSHRYRAGRRHRRPARLVAAPTGGRVMSRTHVSAPATGAALRWRTVLKYVLLTAFAVPWVLVPVWLIVVNSFKTEGEAALLSLNLPTTWALVENYAAVIVQGNYFAGLRNSLLVTVPTVFVVLLLGSLASWGYARSRRRNAQVFFYITSLSILLPPAVIPTIFLLNSIGLDGTLAGYALMMMGTRIGLVVFLTTGFVRGLPIELEEAAAIDGASRLRTYFSVLLPMLRSILLVGAVLIVIVVWNDFFFGQLLLKTSANATLPLALYSFASASVSGLSWNLVFAHLVLTSAPLVIMYLIAQRRVLAGLTEGGLKA